MIFRSVTIALTLFFLGWSSAFSQPLSTSTAKSPERCTQPIGRVIDNGDSRLPAGSLLCQGDTLQPIGSAKVEVLCYLNRKVLLLSQGNLSSQCSPLKEQEQSLQCTRHNRARCPKRKGSTEARTTPVLIAPYSSIVLDPRPDLVWTPIPGITSYKIQVSGVGVDWSQNVAGNNQLTYPPHQPPLKFGNAYKITIIANQGDSPIAASLATINVVNQNQAQYIKQIVQRVSNLNLSPDQAAYLDLDNLYMSYGLLTQSIEVLKARVEAGSKLPEIYTSLGDRYLEAGLPHLAKPLYENAIQLAQKVDNSTQVEKAKAGLRKIELYSQLPTKIKLDQ
jgi:hypothetical protein